MKANILFYDVLNYEIVILHSNVDYKKYTLLKKCKLLLVRKELYL